MPRRLPQAFLIFLLLLAPCSQASSKEPAQVVLLTSIKTPRIWYRPKGWRISKALEKRFRHAYEDSGYQVRVIHEAGPREIAEVLQNPRTLGAFFVGHSASDEATDGQPAQWDDVILDIHGNDLKEVFQLIHPNLRWLGIVGCNASAIFANFRAQGFYRDNRALQIQSFDKKVDAIAGLTYSLNLSADSLGDPLRSRMETDDPAWTHSPRVVARDELRIPPAMNACPKRRGVVMKARPTTVPLSADVLLLWEGRFLGILPRGADETTIHLDEEAFPSTGKLKIKAAWIRGDQRTPDPAFSLRFESAVDPAGWQVFSDSQGRPIGTWSRLYRHAEAIPLERAESLFDTYEPYSCR